MNLVDALRARPVLAMAALGVMVGSVVGLLHPIAPGAAARAGSELAWQLPPLSGVSRFDEKQFAAVSSRRIWGSMATAAAGKVGADGKPALPWRLTGIILQPLPVALVLAEGSLAVGRVAVGEALPDGDTLLAVTATGITYQHEGCQRELRLYGDPTQSSKPDCAAPSGEPVPESGTLEAH